jgi:prepilin-type processing-associated H-X9-DG protein/prepilin-type N-terminal cleavage/methylation domain-containing protein
MTTRCRGGLSLVELLVVLAIIALLVGLTLPAVQKVRASAARTRCQNNLKQLALALHQYHDRHSALPAGFTPADGRPRSMRLGWHPRVLPYIEQEPLWQSVLQAYATDPKPHTSDHPPHRAVQRTPVPAFYCPADPRPQLGSPADTQLVVAFTSYMGVIGTDKLAPGGTLFLRSSVKLTDIRDGTSGTLLIGERPPPPSLLYGWWYGGIGHDGEGSAEVLLGVRELNHSPLGLGGCPYGPYSFRPGDFQDNCSRFHFWSPHPGGAHFAFADGSVRFLRYSADDILPALATRAGGEAVSVPE